MSEQKTLSRRDLLKGASAAALATLPLAAEAAARHWDREVDVVVVGSGTGMLAALIAANAGLKTLVLEKHPGPGGNTIVSGGVLWIPNNRVMVREGLRDSREGALQYLRHLSLGQADQALMTAFVDRGPDMLDYVEKHTSLRWRVSKMMGAVADYHPEWKGSNVRGRSVEPVQDFVGMAGGALIGGLLTALQAKGVPVLTATPAKRLIAEDTPQGKRVIGIEAEHEGKPLLIRTRRGVLMASGGFERNWEMKLHFLRGPSPYTFGTETNEGDGIHMGMALGADLRNMNEVWGMTVYKGDAEANGAHRGGMSLYGQIERRSPGLIAVNRYGERFNNEGADYDSTWRCYHTWENWGELGFHNLPAFHICDHRVRSTMTLAGKQPDEPLPDWVKSAPTLEELADKLGIDKAGLLATVERFNRNAAEGRDPDFHRGESIYDRNGSADPHATLRPLTEAPFYGAEVSPADLGTCGGLRVDGNAQVIDVFNRPIANLYASGNTAGIGSPGALYGGGGGTLGPAMTFSYIAGMELAKKA
ncbi:MAG: FAD-binding protein [Proteobacteria bacterium]|nr:FAD-binding protein [Pseudomonadota bacterium]HQR05027.1 FAD-dependent oxidoreductase [Rhodocyclaceae bacterium]